MLQLADRLSSSHCACSPTGYLSPVHALSLVRSSVVQQTQPVTQQVSQRASRPPITTGPPGPGWRQRWAFGQTLGRAPPPAGTQERKGRQHVVTAATTLQSPGRRGRPCCLLCSRCLRHTAHTTHAHRCPQLPLNDCLCLVSTEGRHAVLWAQGGRGRREGGRQGEKLGGRASRGAQCGGEP